ncbi:MAG: 2-amino-4-hydroxy-6-hydroxymethyldihydropteridine diphosphokinase [Pigmentiphaga sp.]|uniref:2-amino-4-hydroxy-6- hydroxymethyldihydropteridine diphosphokinase n=1 Tax=Pigmentiphaga sp. TaxID=1977564 RepID=UPI0029A9892B|nr:2-amino-4-hydroxy-6-hydroxymethyldihydropteridine diphosphokinase [Pigmentiphaga sp.]MDX3904461.1 2-amino-4-hydroxy-6-hydroxymethyldihydropteridine diphosphokinase [Pigmentiphaga sp.]
MSAPAWHTAWVALGANLGDARGTLQQALDELHAHPAVRRDAVSGFYRTAPVDANGPDYINAAMRLHTTLPPLALLDLLQDIERAHGRQRPYRNAPRTLDLDLLAYDDLRLDTPRLTLPHPRMHERAFVLRPLADIDPDMLLPQGRVADLLSACADQRVLPLEN